MFPWAFKENNHFASKFGAIWVVSKLGAVNIRDFQRYFGKSSETDINVKQKQKKTKKWSDWKKSLSRAVGKSQWKQRWLRGLLAERTEETTDLSCLQCSRNKKYLSEWLSWAATVTIVLLLRTNNRKRDTCRGIVRTSFRYQEFPSQLVLRRTTRTPSQQENRKC